MSNLYILSYNNYYNRIVKKENTLANYLKQDENYQFLQDTNFNPEDGINTTHVVGGPVVWYDKGNYLIATDENNEIVSRWFIIESTRTRAGQYQLTLRRDLVVDYYNSILNSPMYIEKATVQDNDPAIWNNEGVSVNQIKTKEYLLNDQSRSSWIVGYYDKKYVEDGDQTINIKFSSITPNFYIDTGFDTWASENIESKNYVQDVLFRTYIYIDNLDNYSYYVELTLDGKTKQWSSNYKGMWDTDLSRYNYHYYPNNGTLPDFAQMMNERTNIKQILNQLSLYSDDIKTTVGEDEYAEILNYSGKVIEQTNTELTRRVELSENKVRKDILIETDKSTIDGINSLNTYLTSVLNQTNAFQFEQRLTIDLFYYNTTFDVNLIDTDEISLDITIPQSANSLDALPYNVFAIPYKQLSDLVVRGNNYYRTSLNHPDFAMSVAQEIAKQMGTNLYDIQLLPFYPTPNQWETGYNNQTFIHAANNITDTDTYTVCRDFYYNKQQSFLMFFPTKASGNINQYQLELRDSKTKEIVDIPSITNKKIENECDLYRLCSPNYNGQFEFNAAKLDGLTGFECDYTYLPYSPYIKLNPMFSGLYGSDFDDARGVNCQGDFSISYASSQWSEYQISNKNYANIFNREIQNLEVQQEYEQKQQEYAILTSAVQGAAMGAMAGSSMGVGKISSAVMGGVGAVAGAATMAGAASADLYYGNKLRAEALDYKTDMYNYQLDNIKAMPNSLAKVSAYTENNKIFPILEYYTCTDTEKRAIANKIAYNGMTVMRIGTMNEFINNKWSYNGIQSQGYIKGKLIRLTGVEEDYVIVNAISGELDKGVFIQ